MRSRCGVWMVGCPLHDMSPYPWSSVKITTKFSCSLANPDEPKPSATPKPSAPSFKPFKKEEVMRNNLPNALPRWKKKKPGARLVYSFKIILGELRICFSGSCLGNSGLLLLGCPLDAMAEFLRPEFGMIRRVAAQ